MMMVHSFRFHTSLQSFFLSFSTSEYESAAVREFETR